MGSLAVPPEEMFLSSVRSRDDLGAFFEYDGETGYFYLYDPLRQGGERIVNSIHVISGNPDFREADLEIRWSPDEQTVGLLIRGQPWAAFSGKLGFGGNYRPGGRVQLPDQILRALKETA